MRKSMSFGETALLGAIAGFTIFFGLPLGRLERVSATARAFLTMTSAGILVFLFFDIFSHIKDPIEASLKAGATGSAPSSNFALLFFIFVAGIALGLIGLVAFEMRLMRVNKDLGQALTPRRLALMIAAGLGLHNFSEGLAIGQSAGQGQLALAALLIV